MKTIRPEQFKVTTPIRLNEVPTRFDVETSEKRKEKELQKIREKLSKLQDTMYAHNKYGVLICLQGMDTAGKDSLIRELF
jgi:polyphosphate kinase 2 (PPK2 family)